MDAVALYKDIVEQGKKLNMLSHGHTILALKIITVSIRRAASEEERVKIDKLP